MRVVDSVGGEFAYLIDGGVADYLILEGDGQHLVGAEGLAEGNEAELLVVGVFAAVEQPGTLNFLKVAA